MTDTKTPSTATSSNKVAGKTASKADTKAAQLEPKEISDYLRLHPDFFIDNHSLLADLKFNHESGDAISLVERQVSVLRERNTDLRHRLEKLLSNARTNDQLFEKSKRLILNFLDADDLGDVIDALFYSFEKEFSIERTSLILYGEPSQLAQGARQVDIEDARKVLAATVNNNKSSCGNVNSIESEFLFGDHSKDIGSAAIIPLSHGRPLGILAIGNKDPQFYRSSVGTIFLGHIGDVLSRLLPKYLDASASG